VNVQSIRLWLFEQGLDVNAISVGIDGLFCNLTNAIPLDTCEEAKTCEYREAET